MKPTAVLVVMVLSVGTTNIATASPPAQAKPGAVKSCSLFTKAEIKKITAGWTPGLMFDQLAPTDEEGECMYAGITVQLDAAPVSQFEARRKSYGDRTKFQPLAGVGDQAYTFEQPYVEADRPIVGVYMRAGQHMLVISMPVNPPNTVASTRNAAQALAKAAVPKLK
jgi:hypothetical protein